MNSVFLLFVKVAITGSEFRSAHWQSRGRRSDRIRAGVSERANRAQFPFGGQNASQALGRRRTVPIRTRRRRTNTTIKRRRHTRIIAEANPKATRNSW